MEELAKGWAKTITKLSCNGHHLNDIREYPLSLIIALDESMDALESEKSAYNLYLNSLAAQGKPETIEKQITDLMKA